MTLTKKEIEMIKAFLEEGCAVNGATEADHLLEDNMTWMNADDLKGVLGWSKESIGGVMASLSNKGYIQDSGDSPRGAKVSDWYADDKAIEEYFYLVA